MIYKEWQTTGMTTKQGQEGWSDDSAGRGGG